MAHHETSREIEDLRGDVAKIRSEVADIAAALKDLRKKALRAADVGDGEYLDRVRHAWGDVRDRSRQSVQALRERGRHSVAAVEHRVEEKPLMAVLTVLGAGVALGSLLGLMPWSSHANAQRDDEGGHA
jgi:ElaB/YqjD/DUF883 family membrane-anchored ribosome-binding protein